MSFPRLVCRLRSDPPIVLWQGDGGSAFLSADAIGHFTKYMSDEWDVWLEQHATLEHGHKRTGTPYSRDRMALSHEERLALPQSDAPFFVAR